MNPLQNRMLINHHDYEYHKLLRMIRGGVNMDKDDRTGVGTCSIFGEQLRFNISIGFPLLTTKKVWFKGVVHELLWFLSGSTNIKYLNDNKVHIWDEWADEEGELGPVYGKQWVSWEAEDWDKFECQSCAGEAWYHEHYKQINQIQQVIDTLKTDPDSRRMIVSAWNVGELEYMKLPPCHYSFQFYSNVINGKRHLSMLWNQRAVDTFLGLPFNIASYALLLHMVAQVTDHVPYELIFNGGDCHIYKNHTEQVDTQLSRYSFTPPKLELNPKINNIFDFTYDDIKLINYQSHPSIKAPIAV